MRLKLPPHFQGRMLERGISVDHVKKAIASPDKREEAFEGRSKVVKKIEGKTLEVIYYQEGFKDKKEEYIVITAYYVK